MKLGLFGYRLILLVVALAGLGLTIAADINAAISWQYFRTIHLLNTLTFWLGMVLAIACLIEDTGLIAWRRFHPPGSPAPVGIGSGAIGTAR